MEIFAVIALGAVVWWIASQIGHRPPPPQRRATQKQRSPLRQDTATARTAAQNSKATLPTPPKPPAYQTGETLEGPAYIIDGDSLRIQKTEIRLFGVDAPEINHPYGQKANWKLHALCKSKKITAKITAIDHFGRTVDNAIYPTEQIYRPKWSSKGTQLTGRVILVASTNT